MDLVGGSCQKHLAKPGHPNCLAVSGWKYVMYGVFHARLHLMRSIPIPNMPALDMSACTILLVEFSHCSFGVYFLHDVFHRTHRIMFQLLTQSCANRKDVSHVQHALVWLNVLDWRNGKTPRTRRPLWSSPLMLLLSGDSATPSTSVQATVLSGLGSLTFPEGSGETPAYSFVASYFGSRACLTFFALPH